MAGFQVADIAPDETEPLPGVCPDPALDLVKIVLVAGGKIIETHHPLPQIEQGFEQIGADEAGDAGHQPGGGLLPEMVPALLIRVHFVYSPGL
jgi:hypothetical protein